MSIKYILSLNTFDFSLYENTLPNSFKTLPFLPNSKAQSKSHTQDLIGFISTSDADVGVGLDIEISNRVTKNAAQRICVSSEEYTKAPNPAALWCAKEAAFKGLKDLNQPKTIMGVTIHSWSHLQNIDIYKIQSPYNNRGVVIHKSQHTFSFFKIDKEKETL